MVPTRRDEGSKLGGAGGADCGELRRRAAWMGVAAGVDAEGPDVPGVEESPGISPTC